MKVLKVKYEFQLFLMMELLLEVKKKILQNLFLHKILRDQREILQ
nr:MAG TPA: hypothetical protein [Bacteriophage sp.]